MVLGYCMVLSVLFLLLHWCFCDLLHSSWIKYQSFAGLFSPWPCPWSKTLSLFMFPLGKWSPGRYPELFLESQCHFPTVYWPLCLDDPPASQTQHAWNWPQTKTDSSLSSSDLLMYSQSLEVTICVINSSRSLQSLKNLPIHHLFFPNPVLIWDLILSLKYWNHVLAIFLDPTLLPASLHPVHCCQVNLKPLVQLSLFWLSTSICTRFLTQLGLASKTASFYSHSVYRPLIPNQTLSLCEEKTYAW